jgi:hypothetical protein
LEPSRADARLRGQLGDAIADAYEHLAGTLRMQEFGGHEPRPALAAIDPPLKLIARELFGEAKILGVSRAVTAGGASIADLAGFDLPEIILPLGQVLRHAWTRALWVLSGIELDR